MTPWLIALNGLAFLLVTAYAVYVFAYLVKSRYLFIRLGQPVQDAPRALGERLKHVWINVFGQKKLLKDKKSGLMHVAYFYGFIIIQFGALDLFLKGLIPGTHLPVPFYDWFLWFEEVTVFIVLIALLFGIYRRYIERLKRLEQSLKAGLVYIFLGIILLTVMLSGGLEMIATHTPPTPYRPISSAIAYVFSGMSAQTATVLYYVVWWIHLLDLLAFLVYIPQSKHAHLIAAPINVFLKRLDPPGKLKTIDFSDETQEVYGVQKIEQLTQKQLLDLYACVECGRCTSVCPASTTGKTLSPMHLITKLRDHLTLKGAAITSRTPWMPDVLFHDTVGNRTAREGQEAFVRLDALTLAGDVITEEELWACTTCRNCEDQCPVMNEHVDKIIDLRRYLVLTEGKMPAEVSRTFQNIERQGNPWGISKNERAKWRGEIGSEKVPTVKENPDFEWLLWVGSMGSYDQRSVKISEALVKILNEAGVNFAILGNEEKNTGDTARRLGNEFLFQQLADENIATFKKYGVKKILTFDPHAYNTFTHEYPEFGFEGEVMHHTVFLQKLLEEGKITPKRRVDTVITYHDSCYLGRYNNIFDAPRAILRAIPGVKLVEISGRNRENAMCCGAGGGLMWMEEKQGIRVNLVRTEQALSTGAEVIASACPYCLTMMEDGVKMKESEALTYDVVEILAYALGLIERPIHQNTVAAQA
ncbi:MAG: (Fe-S)-binding protein [Candidatus Carbobacillus sp.]|nr:(Fe-S)-binding protein [Candidatus Carbobacillus sp.]